MMKYFGKSKITHFFIQSILIIVSAGIGYHYGKAIEYFNIESTLGLLAMVIVIISLSVVAIQYKLTADDQTKHADQIKEIVSSLVNRKATLYDLDEAYTKIAQEVEKCEKSVTLLTRHRYSEKTGSINIPYDESKSESKKEFYSSLINAITKKEIYFTRVIQVDNNLISDWHKGIKASEFLTKEILSIYCPDNKINNSRSEVFISSPEFEFSFILIDDRKLFFNIFSIDSDGKYSSPRMFYVKTESGTLSAFEDMVKSITKMETTHEVTSSDCRKLNEC
ncbi:MULTISPECIES: hypothetical protein [Vibrio harveyi group]|nr:MULTISPECIES: hypothetical protein [Vibrio harveyi group]MCQ9086306.1 hypothetical protein [Vibrio harveyi]